MKDQVVGICNVGGRVPHIKYRTVEWLRLVLKPHIPRKGEVISPPFWIPPAWSTIYWRRREKVTVGATLNKEQGKL